MYTEAPEKCIEAFAQYKKHRHIPAIIQQKNKE